MALLDISELKVSIDRTPILNGLSLQLNAGEILGVAGESGSGKTMTALAIAGLLPGRARKSGKIVLDGALLSAASEKEFCKIRGRDIGIVFPGADDRAESCDDDRQAGCRNGAYPSKGGAQCSTAVRTRYAR